MPAGPAVVDGVLLDLGAVRLPLDGGTVCGRPCSLEVEIGAGKGRFLLDWAQAHPESCFVAVERARKYLLLGAARAARRGLGNVRFVHTTAEDLLFRCLAAESVAGVHVYFPDPWPKKRHHKRRFLGPANVRRMAEVLVPGGLLRIKTDHEGYAEEIAAVLAAEALLEPADVDDAFAGVPPTSFEVKYEQESRPVHRWACRRAGGGG